MEMTPQERMALSVLAVLLIAGGGARHLSARAEARNCLEYSAENADTLDPAGSGLLLQAAEKEMDLERIRGTPLGADERIDPNEAPAEQLDRLPRVGPALAERIIAHRETHGPFRSLEDVDAVSGIGPALLEEIAPHLSLRGRTASGRRGERGAGQIDINRASVDELQELPGVGPALAARIVASREKEGRFRDAACRSAVSRSTNPPFPAW